MAVAQIGSMRERLLIQRADPRSFEVASAVRVGSLVTVTTLVAHGFASNDFVVLAGAVEAYNGKFKITVTGTLTFTYTTAQTPTSPATGVITATYASDAQGGRKEVWRDLATVPAELIPLRATEILQQNAIQSQTSLRFRVRVRADLQSKQRAQWTPRWPPGSATRTLQILGVLPFGDGRDYVSLECQEAAA